MLTIAAYQSVICCTESQIYGAPSRNRIHHLFLIHLVTQSCKVFHQVDLFFTIRSLDIAQSHMYGTLINYRSHYSV